jgi:type I restriction enzyme S subunit
MTDNKNFVPSCLRVSELLEQHFDTAFAAPDGIKKLRELILTLAMQGKLVEQDPNDPPASELLREIEREMASHEGTKTRRKGEKLPPIKPEEIPYDLPNGWEWVRVGNICHDWGQKTPESKFTYIDVGAINNKSGTVGQNTQILNATEAPSRARKIVKPGTIIYSTVRPYLLNIAIIEKNYDPEPIASTAFAIIHPYASISDRFIYYYFRSPIFIRYVESMQKGVAYPAINDSDFFSGFFPLPPLPEQQRIVARIDQLMARCDELEKLRKELDEKRLAVHAAAIKQLLGPSLATSRLHVRRDSSTLSDFVSSCETQEPFAFLARHFDELYTVKENVAELRKAILQLAVMGRLVPQDPNDPPASELLKEIENERVLHEGTKTRRMGKNLPEIIDQERPHEIPSSWVWVRFGDIAQHNSGKTLDKGRNTGQPRDYITTSNLYWGRFELDNVRQMLIRDDELEKCTAKKYDLLICEGGEAGRAAVWRFDSEVCFQNHIHRARFYKDIDPYFAYRFFEKLNVTGEINQHRKGVGISNMSSKALASIMLPLPPLPEQKRIVACIDQLMELCDQLELQIDAVTGKQTQLLNALIAKI